ncbi:MAG: nuclear transport factor 2 family protein [Ignavibacteriaceae bacterium]
MKNLRFLLAAFVLLVSSVVLANGPDGENESAVKQTITNYINGIDSRNPDAVEKTLYSGATVLTVNSISNKTNQLSSNDVISRVKNGSLGGWKREVSFGEVELNDKTAMAKVEVSDSKLKQTCFLTLVNDNGQWKIVSDVSIVSQNK